MTEYEIQKECVSWARDMSAQHPKAWPLAWLYAIPNEAKRSYALAARMKASGMLSGVADMCLPYPKIGGDGFEYGALYIEMKEWKKGLSDNQKLFQSYCGKANNAFVVCRSLDEFRDAVEWYLGIKESK